MDFDPQKMNIQKDGKQDTKAKEIKTSSDLVKTLNLSAEAQVKALTGNYEAKSTLEIAAKSEAHQYSETKLFYKYLKNDTNILLTEAISLKPEYLPLLNTGLQGLDEFRARCGNAFVVGQQTGTYYFGTSYISSSATSTGPWGVRPV